MPQFKDCSVTPRPCDHPDLGIDAAIRQLINGLAGERSGSLDDGTLHARVIGDVERPLIEVVLACHGGNQLRAARAGDNSLHIAGTARPVRQRSSWGRRNGRRTRRATADLHYVVSVQQFASYGSHYDRVDDANGLDARCRA
ncbi:MAG: helix-turn-helix domain-containing protein [Pseudomonadota bacterium]|nr:helix-turn-helix domain-containing protein [Pseudomonadota bacterium]